MRDNERNCTKCGSSPSDDPTITLHRFPQPSKATKSRCKTWAKFCFPDKPWYSLQFQKKLYNDHKMLCDKHFKTGSFHGAQLKTRSVTETVFQSIKQEDTDEQNESQDEDSMEMKIEPEESGTESEETVYLQSNNFETRSQRKKRASESPFARDKQIKIKKPQSPQKFKPVPNTLTKKNSKNVLQKEQSRQQNHNSPKETNNASDSQIGAKQFQRELDEASNTFFARQSKYEQNDECNLYGKLLNRKLRTYSVHERNLIMFKIDGLLIEHPPGFDSNISPETDNFQISMPKTKPTTKAKSVKQKKTKNKTLLLALDETSSSEQLNEAPQVTSTSMTALSPGRTISKNTEANQAAKVTSSVQHPIKISRNNPNHPAKVLSNMSNKPIPSNAYKPLHISIPETKVVPYTQSTFVPPTPYSRGIIKIIKAKASSKYVPSSQPPILITVPSTTNVAHRSESSINALEHLSSVASTRFPIRYEPEQIELAEDMDVVSHEVILE